VSTMVYVSLVPTAAQVGLAADRLQGEVGFQILGHGVIVFAVLRPVIAVNGVGLPVVALVLFNQHFMRR